MLSISFLPWVLLLLAIIVSIPVASFIENRRRQQALAEYEAELARERAVVEGAESEEIIGEGIGDDGQYHDQDALAGSGAQDDAFADTSFGEQGTASAFDDDAFK